MPELGVFMSVEAKVFACRFCGAKNRISPTAVAHRPGSVNCGSCKRPLFLPQDAPLTGISSKAYEHPLDRKALAMLRNVPGVNSVLRFFLKELSERRMRMLFQQSAVKVTDRHLPMLKEKVEHVAKILDLGYVPELFVMRDRDVNAFAVGVDQPFILVTTELLDLMDEDQITGVIAHECGHIQAGHQLYRTALYLIVNFADRLLGGFIPMRDAALQAVSYALLQWNRCSELTADRAQMLIQRDFYSYAHCEMKLAGGGAYTNDHLDVEAFLDQADEAVAMQEESLLNRYFAGIQSANTTHPFPVWRVGHMKKWIYEGDFLDIVHGSYALRKDAVPEPEIVETETPDSISDMIKQWKRQVGN